MKKQITIKQTIINQLIKAEAKGKEISYKALAEKCGLEEKNLRSWLWCLENRDHVIMTKPSLIVGQVIIFVEENMEK